MMRKTIVEMRNYVDALINDNTNGEISPADVRAAFNTLLDGMSPAAARLRLASSVTLTLGTGYTQIPFSLIDVNSVEVSAGGNPLVVTQQPGGASRVTFQVNAEGPSGLELTAELFINGAASGQKFSFQLFGVSAPVAESAVVILPRLATPTTFDVWLKSEFENRQVTVIRASLLVEAQTAMT